MSSPRGLRDTVAGAVLAGALVAAVALASPATATAAPLVPHTLAPPGPVRTGTAAVLPGTTSCTAFPADDIWHADVSTLPVNPRSAQWLSHMQASTRKLHPDFGPSGGFPYGIPVTVVGASHPKVAVTFDYADESDPGPYPLGADTLIEGGPTAGGDRHAIVVDAGTCTLYETFATQQQGASWLAGSGAIWNLGSDALRPAGWTSADAAGLAILPGLLRYDEVVAGTVDHAIRFTTNVTDRSYVWPARHQAGSVNDPSYPPMGAWFRLRADYPTTGLDPRTRAIVDAMKKHGLVLADNGSPWYFQGTADNSWPDVVIAQLKQIPASWFEAVDTSSLQESANSGRVKGSVGDAAVVQPQRSNLSATGTR
jgi:hypothetical protein